MKYGAAIRRDFARRAHATAMTLVQRQEQPPKLIIHYIPRSAEHPFLVDMVLSFCETHRHGSSAWVFTACSRNKYCCDRPFSCIRLGIRWDRRFDLA